MSDFIKRMDIPLYQGQIDAVSEAISLGQLCTGPHLELLEKKLAKMFRKKYVVLTANGFSSLFLALKSSSKSSPLVLTSPVTTCFSMVNAIKAAGGELQYQDIDRSTTSLSYFNELNTKADAIIVPDHFGKIAPIVYQPKKDDTILIEDSCQSFLSRKNTDTNADVVVLSFYPTKIVNGIDGGALLTDDDAIYRKAKELVYYGEQYKYEKQPRYNLKMNNINAAFTLATLDSINSIEKKTIEIYNYFSDILIRKGVEFLQADKNEVLSKFILLCESPLVKTKRIEHLKKAGVECTDELFFVTPSYEQLRFKNAQRLIEQSFSIPFYSTLKDDEIEYIGQQLRMM